MPGDNMHAGEVATDVSLVGRLLAAQFPRWSGLPIEPVLSAGTDNALYRLGDDMIVRLPRIHWAVDSLAKEHQWLPWLAPRLPVSIPIPLGMGTPGGGYPWRWSVYTWLDGKNPAIACRADSRSIALELADFVAALRRIDPTDGPPTGQTLAMKDVHVLTAIDALHGRIDTDAVIEVWSAALQIPEWTGSRVWIHGDLAPGNVLLVDGRLSAVIDFSGVGVGDPSDDLRIAWNLLPANTRNVFRSALDVDDAAWARGRARALAQALVQLPYYWETNPELATNARHVIREVLADYQHGITADAPE